MNITTDKPYMIFRKDGKYGAMYSIGISKKNQNNGYDNGYIPARFKNGVDIESRTNIYLKNAWLTFYLDKDKKTVPYIFINEFSTVEQTIEKAKEESKEEVKQNDSFEEFSKEADLNELDNLQLPF